MGLRLTFSGHAKKVEAKTIGQDPAVSFSICKKNYAKKGDPDTYTWVNVTVFKAPEFITAKLRDGVFVAGSGEFMLRSYEGKNGKGVSADVRCSSFDLDIAKDDGEQAAPARELPPSQAAAVKRQQEQEAVAIDSGLPF